jgi:hypothetical protein
LLCKHVKHVNVCSTWCRTCICQLWRCFPFR